MTDALDILYIESRYANLDMLNCNIDPEHATMVAPGILRPVTSANFQVSSKSGRLGFHHL